MCLLMEIYIIQEVFLPTNSNWNLSKSLALTTNLQDAQGSEKDEIKEIQTIQKTHANKCLSSLSHGFSSSHVWM